MIHKMNRTSTFILSASCLIAVAGLAVAQPQNTPARQSVQTAERLTQTSTSLANAIATAELHTQGTAIGARLSMNWTPFQQESRGQSQTGQQNRERIEREIREGNPNLTREQVSIQTRQRLDRESRDRKDSQRGDLQPQRGVSDGWLIDDPGQQSPESVDRPRRSPEFVDRQNDELYAIITCVLDSARVREVIVDMRSNSVVGVYAMDGLRDGWSDDNTDRYEREASQTRSAANVRATDLMNATARDASGKVLGNIDELAIDPDSNRVVYAVLRRGGFLGMGESRFAIPTTELSIPHEDRMHLSLTEADFEGQAGFENNDWPKSGDPQWSRTEPHRDAPTQTAQRIVKATNIIGSSVQCRDGRELGNIKDLIVEPRSGRVVYAIINTSNGYLPVPMEMLKDNGDGYTVPMAMDDIQSRPRILANRDPNWNDTAWNRSIYESYGLTIDERYQTQGQSGDGTDGHRTNDRNNEERRDNDRRNDNPR